METKVILPQLGETVVEGTIIKWLKKEGDYIEKDEPLVEISTDKVDTEIPSPVKGKISKLLAKEGDTVQAGGDIAVIFESAKGEKESKAEKKGREIVTKPVEEDKEEKAEKKSSLKGKGKKITPVVAKILSEFDIDINKIEGSGINGRVTKKDILNYLEREGIKQREITKEEPLKEVKKETEEVKTEEEEIIEMSRVRRSIAEHMIKSKHTSPHVTTVVEVDMTRIVGFREENKEKFQSKYDVPLTFTSIIVKAVVNSLKRFPKINSTLQDNKIIIKKYYNIGIATATEEGLIVPVIKRAERLDIKDMAKEIFNLSERAREKKLPLDALQGGTFTITNPGVFGAIFSTPIIHQPQAAILGVEAIRKLPAVIDDAIAIRSMMNLCLSYDHRVIDGIDAGRFLQDLKKELEEGLKLEV